MLAHIRGPLSRAHILIKDHPKSLGSPDKPVAIRGWFSGLEASIGVCGTHHPVPSGPE